MVIKEIEFEPSEISVISAKILGVATRPAWIAGGAARRLFAGQPLGQSDLDIFFSSVNDMGLVRRSLFEMGFLQRYHSNRAETWVSGGGLDQFARSMLLLNAGTSVQLCSSESSAGLAYPDLEALFRSFDFTVAMFAFDGQRLFAAEGAVEDLQDRRLRVLNPSVKVPSVVRMLKYLDEGFTPEPVDLPWLFDLTTCKDGDVSLITRSNDGGY